MLGVDIRGRSQTLRINYRTSHQIRMFADKLLDPEISDVDGNIESRAGTISVFNGPIPVIKTFASEEKEIDAVKRAGAALDRRWAGFTRNRHLCAFGKRTTKSKVTC